MIRFISKAQEQKRESVILFIHGIGGGRGTWVNNNNNKSFGDLLNEYPEIQDNFDIAEFDYYTKIFGSQIIGFFKKMLDFSGVYFKNIPIVRISQLLDTDIDAQLSPYKHIIIIAHSMGGLVTKSYLVGKKWDAHKVRLVLAIDVPYKGSALADVASMFSPNINLKEMESGGAFTDLLERAWLALEVRPVVKYFYGAYDHTVSAESALQIKVTSKLTTKPVIGAGDHTTITKPMNSSDSVIIKSLGFLKEFAEKTREDKYKPDENYNVVKVLIVDDNEVIADGIMKRFRMVNNYYRPYTNTDIRAARLEANYIDKDKLKESIESALDSGDFDFLLLDRRYIKYVGRKDLSTLDDKKLYYDDEPDDLCVEKVLKLVDRGKLANILGAFIYTNSVKDKANVQNDLQQEIQDILPGKVVEVLMTHREIYDLADTELYDFEKVPNTNYKSLGKVTDISLYGVFMGEILYHRVVFALIRRGVIKEIIGVGATKYRMEEN